MKKTKYPNRKLAKLFFDNVKRPDAEIASILGIHRANLTQWRKAQTIPLKHVKSLFSLTNVPSDKVAEAYHQDLEDMGAKAGVKTPKPGSSHAPVAPAPASHIVVLPGLGIQIEVRPIQ